MVKIVKLLTKMLECLRCGHSWRPRKEVVTICPKCKSPYWDRERETK